MGDFTWNLQTDEVSWSRGMYQLLQYDPEESIDYRKINPDIYHPDDIERVTSWFKDSIAFGKEELISSEYRLIRKDGEIIHVRTNGRILYENGKPITLLGTCLNITEQKEAENKQKIMEAQLRQSHKLEAVGTMVGGISHELNNILQSMFLYGGLVQDELPDNPEIQANIRHLLNDGKRARDIVKQILTFSRKTKVDLQPHLLHELVMGALSLERASLPANIEIKQDIDMNCGPVLCDKTQVHQVIINLCNNAKHAIGDSEGILTVSLQQIQASIGANNPEVDVLELKVIDTGQGMDAETLEKIFNPFFTTKEIGQGTGLGLSVIHGIIEMMGGQISVTSEHGSGTVFSILLPITDKINEITTSPEPVTRIDNYQRSILLVDDEDSIREPTEVVLTRKGFTVTGAVNGKQALELFRTDPGQFDLIVTDQSMPILSGTDLAKEIRNLKSDVPIILSTGQLGIEDIKEYTDIGITGFIQKPWTAKELIEQIQTIDD